MFLSTSMQILAGLPLLLGQGSTLKAPQFRVETAAEVSHFDSSLVFRQFDRDGNGIIEPSELPSVRGPVRTILESRDRNGDGFINNDEFFDETPVRLPQLPAVGNSSQQRSLFDVLDANKDGQVTRDEVRPEFKAAVEPYFRRKGSGTLTRSDMDGPAPVQTQVVPFFSLLDANKDGIVTRLEIDAARENPMGLQLSGIQTRPMFDALASSDLIEFSPQQFNDALANFRKSVERRNRKRVFDQLDTNGDGVVSVEEAEREFRPVLEQVLSRAKLPLGSKLKFDEFERAVMAANVAPELETDKRVPAAFRVLDANRDGVIEPSELTNVVDRLGVLDVNRDDRLSVDEFLGADNPEMPAPQLPAARQEPAPQPKNRADKFVEDFFSSFDKDKNGKLTPIEIPEKASPQISKLDFDGDGAISRAELKEGLMKK
ncbi:MAG: EF-hand domain-containing protein [Planctomycetaceae bacterium]